MFEGSIVTALKASPDITSRVGIRIFPLDSAQGAAMPYLGYSIEHREDASPTHDGPSGVTRVTYDIVTVGEKNKEVAELAQIVRRILSAHSGISNQVDVWHTSFEDETDIEQRRPQGAEKAIFVRASTFTALYSEV